MANVVQSPTTTEGPNPFDPVRRQDVSLIDREQLIDNTTDLFGLPVMPENIPADLKALKRWVLWRASPRKGTPGKMDKRPYRPDGTPASKTTSAHWSDFSAVWAAYERGGFNGIGICLTADLGIVGVDFDRCIDADGVLSDAAQDAIARLNTYTERSPSGRGIRMLAYGAIERNFNNQDAGVEMYHDGAFLTITGHIL